ncbi:ABC transporter substrate-binding protein [Austwickia chelonae]|uniref:ABC transporter substrate-binding protein n=1 Tax=Austwickia chelonae TaxID=100225 RepID=UPI000E274449|nr:ABC transporter substrate-binding protein [Austwickia chelonae]
MPAPLFFRRTTTVAAVAVTALLPTSCSLSTDHRATGSPGQDRGCITDFDPEKDYYPDKVVFEDATNVKVQYKKSHKIVTVAQPAPGAPPQTYVLVRCGAPAPELTGDLAGARKFSIPAKRVAAASTTQVPAYDLLGKVDALVGVGSADKLAPGTVKEAVDAGRIKGFKQDGVDISAEQVVSLKPDLYVTSGTSKSSDVKLAELGVPVVANAEWLEKTALGRAEWTKFTALFLDEEKKATEVYAKIRADYQAVAEKAKSVASRPTVLLGSMSRGTWYATAADSYVANEIKDAGGDYILQEVAGTGSKPLDLEVVLGKGSQAQFWLGATHSSPWKSLAEPVKDDARLGNLEAVKNGRVWTFTKRMTPGGGNDYWQSGVVRPDRVLADLVAILHPELMPGHEFTYYEQVPKA